MQRRMGMRDALHAEARGRALQQLAGTGNQNDTKSSLAHDAHARTQNQAEFADVVTPTSIVRLFIETL